MLFPSPRRAHSRRRSPCLDLIGIRHPLDRFANVFDTLHEDLRRAGRRSASLDDVERVYDSEMLGIRGQMDLEHYESRLRMVLGDEGYRVALEMLTEAARTRRHSGRTAPTCA